MGVLSPALLGNGLSPAVLGNLHPLSPALLGKELHTHRLMSGPWSCVAGEFPSCPRLCWARGCSHSNVPIGLSSQTYCWVHSVLLCQKKYRDLMMQNDNGIYFGLLMIKPVMRSSEHTFKSASAV